MSSSSPSPSISSQHAVTSSSPALNPSHISRRTGQAEFEISSYSSNSRDPTPDTDSEMSSSDDEQGPLPSLGEFWSGRLPSGAGLDTSIRSLGIGQPLPPARSVGGPHSQSRFGCGCVLSVDPVGAKGDSCMMTTRAPPSTSSSANFDNPFRLRRPHSPEKADIWTPRIISPAAPGYPYVRDSGSRRSHSIDTDSDDGHSHTLRRPSDRPYAYAPQQTNWKATSQHSSRASASYDSDTDMPRSRPSSSHSYSSDRLRRYQHPYSDYGSAVTEESHITSSNWEDYVEKAGRLNGAGPVMYTCMWRKHEGQVCSYTGKKQLAKRHVESVHLGKKPHVCPECRKPFPQKTSLDIHIRSVHTFQKPLKCEHCEACFSDPARRHKHYRVEHPEKVITKTRMKIDYKDIKHLLKK